MPTKFKSPHATSFNSAIKKGTPCSVAVESIAKRNNKTTKSVFESLFKAGLCCRQKINGQFVYWPTNGVPGTATNAKAVQVNLWQSLVDWCICSGCCTPEQLQNCCGSQATFMDLCKKYFTKQVTGNFKKVTPRKTTAARTRATSTARKGRSSVRSYATSRKTSRTRRLRRAA